MDPTQALPINPATPPPVAATPNPNKAPEMDPGLGTAESDVLKNIVSTETGENDKAILGDAPELDISLLQDVAPQKSVLLIILKTFFGLLFFASVASVLFFTSQLSSTFDFATSKFNLPNVSEELASTNSEIITLQTELNLNRYQQAKAAFDRFSSDGDEFLQLYETSSSQTSSEKEVKQAQNEMKKIRNDLKDSFLEAQVQFSKNFSASLIDVNYTEAAQLQTLFEEKLRALIAEKIATSGSAEDSQTKRDQRNYQQILGLVGNTQIKDLVIPKDFDALKDEELYGLIKQINSLIVNDLSVIQEIKNKRIKWSDVIDEIKNRTTAVDSHFNGDFYNDLGGIRYNSYDFDTATRKISLTGETKTIDTTTFTMIADLIDEINQSKFFQNAEMRSFSKAGSVAEGYLATLRLVFDLKDNSPEQNNQ